MLICVYVNNIIQMQQKNSNIVVIWCFLMSDKNSKDNGIIQKIIDWHGF